MEQYKRPLQAFMKPILNTLKHTSHYQKEILPPIFTDVMPLLEVVETIHHSYYFKKEIVLQFEQYTSNGELHAYTKIGTIRTPIQQNQQFVFIADNLTYLLNLEQIVSAIQVTNH